MIWLVLIGAVIVFIILIALTSNNNYASDNLLTGPTEKEDKDSFLKMDLPDFNYDEPIKCLRYINDIPKRYVKNAIYNLDIHGRIKNRLYHQAFAEKDSNGTIDIEKYLEKFRTFERGNFILDNEASKGYEIFEIIDVAGVHIDFRKSYIVDNIKEGDPVTLIPEPTNKFDRNAIQVVHQYFPFGYIPAIDCNNVKKLLTVDHKAFITDLVYQGDGFIDVEITLYKKK